MAAQSATLGDLTLLPDSLNQATPREITGLFGAEFAADLAKAPAGPCFSVESGYGTHIVKVRDGLHTNAG